MSEIQPGEIVRCIKTWTTYVVDRGVEYEVAEVSQDGARLLVNGEWVPVLYFEKAWSAPETATRIVLQRRVKGTEKWAESFPRFREGEDAAEEALGWLKKISTSPLTLKGLPLEYRVIEVETTERCRVLGEAATPPRETS